PATATTNRARWMFTNSSTNARYRRPRTKRGSDTGEFTKSVSIRPRPEPRGDFRRHPDTRCQSSRVRTQDCSVATGDTRTLTPRVLANSVTALWLAREHVPA